MGSKFQLTSSYAKITIPSIDKSFYFKFTGKSQRETLKTGSNATIYATDLEGKYANFYIIDPEIPYMTTVLFLDPRTNIEYIFMFNSEDNGS